MSLDKLLKARDNWNSGSRGSDTEEYREAILSQPANVPPNVRGRDFRRCLGNADFYNDRYQKIRNAMENGLRRHGMWLENINPWQSVVEWLTKTDEYYMPPGIVRSDETPQREFYTRQGLLFYGKPGTGKSFTAGSIRTQWRETYLLPVRDMEEHFGAYGYESFQYEFGGIIDDRTKVVIFDDVGIEYGAQSFGTRFDVGGLLLKRYELWQCYKTPTIVTTNLNGLHGLRERYGEAVFSRCSQMLEPVLFGGKDTRLSFLDEPL